MSDYTLVSGKDYDGAIATSILLLSGDYDK